MTLFQLLRLCTALLKEVPLFSNFLLFVVIDTLKDLRFFFFWLQKKKTAYLFFLFSDFFGTITIIADEQSRPYTGFKAVLAKSGQLPHLVRVASFFFFMFLSLLTFLLRASLSSLAPFPFLFFFFLPFSFKELLLPPCLSPPSPPPHPQMTRRS